VKCQNVKQHANVKLKTNITILSKLNETVSYNKVNTQQQKTKEPRGLKQVKN